MAGGSLLLYAAIFCAAVAAAALGYGIAVGGLRRYSSWQAATAAHFREQFRLAHIEALESDTAATLYCGALVVLPLFSVFVLQSLVSALAGIAVIVLTPRVIIGYLRQGRITLIEEQLPGALDQIGRSISAGLSLAQAIEEASETAPAPLNHEFSLIAKDHTLGSSMSESISLARSRLESRQFDLVATALLVSIDKGGDLKGALATISQSMKEIWRLEQKLITASSEGRKAMLVISVVPLFVLLLVAFLQPELAATLTGSLGGIAILTVAGLMYFGGFLWLRRILATEI